MLIFIPLVILLPYVFSDGVAGVFFAQLITDAAVLLLGSIFMIIAFKNIRKEEKQMTAIE